MKLDHYIKLAAAGVIVVGIMMMSGVVWLASRGDIDAVRAAIFAGAIGQAGTIATALVSVMKGDKKD